MQKPSETRTVGYVRFIGTPCIRKKLIKKEKNPEKNLKENKKRLQWKLQGSWQMKANIKNKGNMAEDKDTIMERWRKKSYSKKNSTDKFSTQ